MWGRLSGPLSTCRKEMAGWKACPTLDQTRNLHHQDAKPPTTNSLLTPMCLCGGFSSAKKEERFPSTRYLTIPRAVLIKEVEVEPVPRVRVIFYREDDGTVPMAEWLDGLQKKPRQKCFEWIERLMNYGH